MWKKKCSIKIREICYIKFQGCLAFCVLVDGIECVSYSCSIRRLTERSVVVLLVELCPFHSVRRMTMTLSYSHREHLENREEKKYHCIEIGMTASLRLTLKEWNTTGIQ